MVYRWGCIPGTEQLLSLQKDPCSTPSGRAGKDSSLKPWCKSTLHHAGKSGLGKLRAIVTKSAPFPDPIPSPPSLALSHPFPWAYLVLQASLPMSAIMQGKASAFLAACQLLPSALWLLCGSLCQLNTGSFGAPIRQTGPLFFPPHNVIHNVHNVINFTHVPA